MQGIIFKIIGGTRAYELRFTAMSNQHAQTVAHELHASLGLIGGTMWNWTTDFLSPSKPQTNDNPT